MSTSIDLKARLLNEFNHLKGNNSNYIYDFICDNYYLDGLEEFNIAREVSFILATQ